MALAEQNQPSIVSHVLTVNIIIDFSLYKTVLPMVYTGIGDTRK